MIHVCLSWVKQALLSPLQLCTLPEASRPEAGRGLFTRRALREGDTACNAKALFFNCEETLRGFLAIPGHAVFEDRAVKVSGLRKDDSAANVFAVLCGCAGYMNAYNGARKAPNAVITASPGVGPNEGMLEVAVRTRNQVGVAMGSELVLNYGVGFDLAPGARDDGLTASASGEPWMPFSPRSRLPATCAPRSPGGPSPHSHPRSRPRSHPSLPSRLRQPRSRSPCCQSQLWPMPAAPKTTPRRQAQSLAQRGRRPARQRP